MLANKKEFENLFRAAKYHDIVKLYSKSELDSLSVLEHAEVLIMVAMAAKKLGRVDESLIFYRKIIEIIDETSIDCLDNDDLALVLAHYYRSMADAADILHEIGNTEEELELRSALFDELSEQFRHSGAAPEQAKLLWRKMLGSHGDALYKLCRYEEAAELYKMQLEIELECSEISSTSHSAVCSNVCLALCKAGLEEASRYGAKAIEFARKCNEPNYYLNRVKKIREYLTILSDAHIEEDNALIKKQSSSQQDSISNLNSDQVALLAAGERSVFVSSTFKDMQFERDALQLDMMPELRRRASYFGETIDLIDLRWGVSTTDLDDEEGSRKVLDVCFSEIDRSRPYLICLLGDRYGWVPPNADQLVNRSIGEELRGAIIRTPLEQHPLSVTAMEMVYGTLSKYSDPSRILICIRDKVDFPKGTPSSYTADRPEASKELKAFFESRYPQQIIYYCGKWDETTKSLDLREVNTGKPFFEVVRNRLIECFMPEWQAKKELGKSILRELRTKCFEKHVSDGFIEQADQLLWIEHVLEQIRAGQKRIVIRGAAYSGKTTLSVKLAEEMKQSDELEVISIYAGRAADCEAYEALDGLLIQYLDELKNDDSCQHESQSSVQQKDTLRPLSCNYEQHVAKRIVIVIDAFEQLLGAPATIADVLLDLNDIDATIVLVCSLETPLGAIKDDYYETFYPEFRLTGKLAKRLLAKESKSLSKDAAELLEDRCAKVDDACLYTHIVAARLLSVNRELLSTLETSKDIDNALSALIVNTPLSISEALGALVDDSDHSIEPDISRNLLAILSTTKFGLRRSDIESVVRLQGKEWSELEYSRAIGFFSCILSETESGIVKYASEKTSRELIRSNRLDDYLEHANNAVLSHLLSLPKNTPIREEGIIDAVFAVKSQDILFDIFGNWTSYSSSARRILERILSCITKETENWLVNAIASMDPLKYQRSTFSYLAYAVRLMGDYNWYKQLTNEHLFNQAVLAVIEAAIGKGVDLSFISKDIARVRELVASGRIQNKNSESGIKAAFDLIGSIDENSFEFVRALGSKGIALTRKHDFESAREVFLEELKYAKELDGTGSDHRSELLIGEALVDLGMNEVYDKDYERAIKYFNEAIEILERHLSTYSRLALPPLVRATSWTAIVLRSYLDKENSSIQYFIKSIEYATQWIDSEGLTRTKAKTRRDDAINLTEILTQTDTHLNPAKYYDIAFKDNLALATMSNSDTRIAEECSLLHEQLMSRASRMPEIDTKAYSELWSNYVSQSGMRDASRIIRLPLNDGEILDVKSIDISDSLYLESIDLPEIDPIVVKHCGYVSDTIFNRLHGYNVYLTTSGSQIYSIDCLKKGCRDGDELIPCQCYDAGIQYIVENGYPLNRITGLAANDYIITQTALWWYMSKLPLNRFDGETAKTDIYALIPNYIKPFVANARIASKEFSEMTGHQKAEAIKSKNGILAVILEPHDVRYERMVIVLGDKGFVDQDKPYWRDTPKPANFKIKNAVFRRTHGSSPANIHNQE